jgi:hypothetical protein
MAEQLRETLTSTEASMKRVRNHGNDPCGRGGTASQFRLGRLKYVSEGRGLLQAIITCLSFRSPLATSTGIFNVSATMLAGVRANHCVSEMSTTLSLL